MADAKYTQGVIEWGQPAGPADVKLTQGAIEIGIFEANFLIGTQFCIEVGFPGPSYVPPTEPEYGPGSEGQNDALLILDLSGARDTVPDYEPADFPDYG